MQISIGLDHKAMKKYRLSKYDPIFRDPNGVYTKEEWTSYCDIGTVYDGVVFTKDEYLRMEAKFINVILQVLSSLGANSFWVRKLEPPFTAEEMRNYLGRYGLSMSPEEEAARSSLYEGKKINISELKVYLRLFLRECFWCELHAEESTIVLYWSDEYYMYLRCRGLDENIIQVSKTQGIYIEDIEDEDKDETQEDAGTVLLS